MIYKSRKDPLTGETFVPRRFNQKFASRENQITYNNIKARKKRRLKAPVDRVLDKNRSVILGIIGDEQQVIRSRDFLLGAGFNFSYFSRSLMMSGKRCQLIYEYCVLDNTDGTYLLKKLK